MIDLLLIGILAAFIYARFYVLPRLDKVRKDYENRPD